LSWRVPGYVGAPPARWAVAEEAGVKRADLGGMFGEVRVG